MTTTSSWFVLQTSICLCNIAFSRSTLLKQIPNCPRLACFSSYHWTAR